MSVLPASFGSVVAPARDTTLVGQLAGGSVGVHFTADALQGVASNSVTVRAASTANVSLTGALTHDGVTLATGELFLAKSQTTGSQNGVYTVNTAGSWTRAPCASAWAQLVGLLIVVQEGTANGDSLWLCTSNQGGTLGTTTPAFSSFSKAVGFGSLSTVAVQTSAYSTPGGEIIPTDTSGGAFDIQLPTAPANGTLVWPTNQQAGAGTGWEIHRLGVLRGGSDSIDGVAANATLVAGRGTLLQYTTVGTNWRVLLSDAGIATAGALVAANNLSDLASVVTARANLGVRAAPRASALKTSLFTLAAADAQAQDEATGTWTLTVPAAATLGDNFAYSLANVGSGTVTVDGPGGTNGNLTAGLVGTVFVSNGHVYVAFGTAVTLS